MADLSAGKVQDIAGAEIAAFGFIADFYSARDHQPAWFETQAGEELLRRLAAAGDQGFRQNDFHLDKLTVLAGAARSGGAGEIADYEIVASDAAARYLHHSYFGKVDPEKLDPDWNFGRPMLSGKPGETVSQRIDGEGFEGLADSLELMHPQYLAMKEALKTYQAIEAEGGWPEIASGDPLKPGMQDPRVGVLRARLVITDDLDARLGEGDLYDSALEEAVKRFQARHGLTADGVIGPKSLTALNAPVSDRIAKLRVSLERARWILRGLGDDFVLVNIAGARTYLFRDGEAVWRTRSIVGQRYRKTPVFRDDIKYMEINPTWTVPVSIFRRDKLPRIREDIGYLANGGYMVRNAQGESVDPSSVDWQSDNPGVTLVQRPGPKNALGMVKFMFPNKYAVYLHDTDNRDLFNRAERNLSSGCVRIENPFDFADLIMKGAPDWSADRRDAILASGKTTRVNLPEPLPVLLTYYTAWVERGEIHFREDVYERDQQVLEALDRPFER